MRNKHRRTLEKIFRKPTASDLMWRDVAALIEYLGGAITNKSGSTRIIEFRDEVYTCDEPHNPKTLRKGHVEGVASFLKRAGVEP